jgi:hypothetical protein
MGLKIILTTLLLVASLSVNALDKKTRLICKKNESKVEYEIFLDLNNTAYFTVLVDAQGNKFSSVDMHETEYSLNETPRKLTLKFEMSSGDIYLSNEIIIDRHSLGYLINRFILNETYTERGQCEISKAKLIKKL